MNIPRFHPLRGNIIVKQDPERAFGSGIIVPASKGIVESQVQLGRFGTVLAIGPDIDRDQLNVGSRIVYGEFEHPKTPDGYIILSEMDVCGVID